MINTSLGLHTLAVFHRLSQEEAYNINRDFNLRINREGDMKKRPIKNKFGQIILMEYTYKNEKGIKWFTLSNNANYQFPIYGVKAIITPMVLLGDGNGHIKAANANDVIKAMRLYEVETEKISPILKNSNYYSMNRGDFCINFDIFELGLRCTACQMLELLKQGIIPNHFTERK